MAASTAGRPVASLVEAEAAYRGSAAFEEDRAFFRETLAGVQPALFPSATVAPVGGQCRARHTFTVDAGLVRRIRDAGGSPFAYLAATFAAYFSRVHRTEELVLGVPFRNRHTDAELDTVGQLANNLPLCVPARSHRRPRWARWPAQA
ncbi:hypothetical protein IPZ70_23800 [Streptomyces polychromogenes]|nr:hypothetical protein [Streptomyces polychromogenes]